ncbi:MAG: hypothetical protein ACYC6Y_05990 [Thermoguttaceae bacterium]
MQYLTVEVAEPPPLGHRNNRVHADDLSLHAIGRKLPSGRRSKTEHLVSISVCFSEKPSSRLDPKGAGPMP